MMRERIGALLAAGLLLLLCGLWTGSGRAGNAKQSTA